MRCATQTINFFVTWSFFYKITFTRKIGCLKTKKKIVPQISIKAVLREIRCPFRVAWTASGIYRGKKKHFAPSKAGEKNKTNSTPCSCVSTRIMPHVDARGYADIEKRYPKLPSEAAVVRWWRHGQRARANLSYMLIVTRLVQPAGC